jgi:hypothetical protein
MPCARSSLTSRSICTDPGALARFWGQVTGWPVIEEPAPGYEESAVGMAGEGRPRLHFVKGPDSTTSGSPAA